MESSIAQIFDKSASKGHYFKIKQDLQVSWDAEIAKMDDRDNMRLANFSHLASNRITRILMISAAVLFKSTICDIPIVVCKYAFCRQNDFVSANIWLEFCIC